MATPKINLTPIAKAIVSRLISQIPELNEATCFFCIDPHAEPAPNPGSRWLTVSLGSGAFDETQFAGAGRYAATAECNFSVYVNSPINLDEYGRDHEFLMNESYGVLDLMDQVIDALAGVSLVEEMQANSAGQLLREPIFPNGWSDPIRRRNSVGYIAAVFKLCFDWQMTN